MWIFCVPITCFKLISVICWLETTLIFLASDFLQRPTSATSNEQILPRATSEFQRVTSSEWKITPRKIGWDVWNWVWRSRMDIGCSEKFFWLKKFWKFEQCWIGIRRKFSCSFYFSISSSFSVKPIIISSNN